MSKVQPKVGITFRAMRPGEEMEVCHLVHSSFDHSVAAAFTKRGQGNFKKYAEPEEMARRVREGHFVLLALADGHIAGMIEMRHYRHVSLFFVGPELQGRGIGEELLERAIELSRSVNPHLGSVTVNSSPNARGAYERMGFTATGREQDINGVRSVPMRKVL
ncbi:MAG: GNAT family N-acetyltransferase [bacterium]|nr:GNAT family N-acetyltransferase [bacterium]